MSEKEHYNNILSKAIRKNFINEESSLNFKSSSDYNSYIQALRTLVSFNILTVIGTKYSITPLGIEIFNGIGIDKHIENEKSKRKKEVDKLYYDYLFSKYRYWTFWVVFTIGLFGGLYSIYDAFIKSQSTEEKLEKIREDIQENKKAIKEVRTLILNQKNLDSLSNPNYQSNEQNP